MAKEKVKKKKYSEDSIERYAGLAGIRKKPTVYAGAMDHSGLFTCLREPCDNAVDQALAGRNKSVHIVYDPKPNRFWILDDGEGIPVGQKVFEDERGRKEKLSTFYVVTGLTHGGGNFAGDDISRGTHGIGIKLTNALSTFFKVWTFRDGTCWSIEYSRGKIVQDVKKDKAPKLPHGLKIKRGTAVCFEPELELFEKGSKIQLSDLISWCEVTSYLVPGMEVKFTNEKGKTKTFLSKRGALDFIDQRVAELKCTTHGKPFTFNSKEVDVAIVFTNAEGSELVHSYTNGLRNVQGGEHLKALQAALVKSLVPYKGKLEYKPDDLKEGLLGLINYKIAAPQFNTQTKDKLLDKRVYPVAYPQLLAALEEFWKRNKSLAKEICQRAAELRKRTADFLKDKKLIKKVKTAQKGIAAKLADINNSKTPIEDRELYLVEGDSAGGSAKVARDKSFQAVFPLKGKPLNVMEATKDKVNNNAEIASIFAGIGLDLSAKDPISKIRFGKIIILADADVDGRHINTLTLAVWWKFLPELIKQGRIYIVDSPEFITRHKGKIYFGPTKESLYEQAGTKKLDVRHLKGWGEANAEDLQEMAFDVNKRKLFKILPPKDKEGRMRFEALMGKKPAYRQKLLGVTVNGASEEQLKKKSNGKKNGKATETKEKAAGRTKEKEVKVKTKGTKPKAKKSKR
jgi:DNA gyrase subunit B